MSGLAEQEINQSPTRLWTGRAGLAVLVIAGLALVGWLLSGLASGGGKSGPKRQTVAIKVLPDTPPPPPPKPEDKPPAPKEAPKQMQMEQPKVQAPVQQAPQQLKMEGAAGDGPSAFGAGTVANDYAGGAVGTGTGGTGTQSNRAQYRFFINTARQQLKDQLERHLQTDERQITADFQIWLTAAGEIQRFELESVNKPGAHAQVQAALARTARDLRLAPPPGMPQPVKFRLILQPLG